jgi:hypothetical protein
VLTDAPLSLQCPAASVGVEALDEADDPAVQAFIETLARITSSVVLRQAQDQQEQAEQ